MKAYSSQNYSFEDAAHLLRRAGFGGTPAEVEELRKLGPKMGMVQSPSSNSIFQTAKANGALFFPLLCGLFVVHLIFAAFLPPMEDELYYWAWAQSLQKSYYDHPPMVAYLIRASTAVWGNNTVSASCWNRAGSIQSSTNRSATIFAAAELDCRRTVCR